MIPDALRREAQVRLENAGNKDPARETSLIWRLAEDRTDEADMGERFLKLIDRRAAHEPLSHLRGWRAFYKHRFLVSSDVLDPRPETECLVEAALRVPFQNVLDLGTGSGCILLSLLDEQKAANGIGVDLSSDAIKVAEANARDLCLDNRARFRVSDWFSEVTEVFDLIVSNPPYIGVSEMEELQPEVRLHEPKLALTDGADGLNAYKVICRSARSFLNVAGWLMMEIGPTQAAPVMNLMTQAGLTNVETLNDLDGRDRVVLGQNPADPAKNSHES